MGNKKDRNGKKGNCGYGFEKPSPLTFNSREIPYPATFRFTKDHTWVARGIRGSLSGRSKELNIVGLKEESINV